MDDIGTWIVGVIFFSLVFFLAFRFARWKYRIMRGDDSLER